MNLIISLARNVFDRLNSVGEHLSMLALRLFLAWEFRESGVEKFNGENWFADIQDAFPFPFNILGEIWAAEWASVYDNRASNQRITEGVDALRSRVRYEIKALK